jgi:hypothetical protein
VTIEELKTYVTERVEEMTDNAQHPCMPRLEDFVDASE